MNLRTAFIPVIFLLLTPGPGAAQEPYFYDGARPLSMGGAFTALADDAGAIFYNPAGLVLIEGRRFSVSGYIQQYSWKSEYITLGGINPNFTDRGFAVSYVQGGLGISYSMTGRGWWERVTFGDHDVFLPGAEPYTVKPVNYERILSACWSMRAGARLSIGVTGRYLHFSHYFDSAEIDDTDGASFDAGAIFDLTDGVSIGVNLINLLSTGIDYAVYNDFTTVAYFSELPVNVTAGIDWHPLEALTVTGDVRNILQDDVKNAVNDLRLEFRRSYHIGIEWRPAGWASVRAGWNFRQRPLRQAYPPLPFGTPEGGAYEYGKYNAFTLGTGLSFRGATLDIGVRVDDRRDRMEDQGTREIGGTTALGSASLTYSF